MKKTIIILMLLVFGSQVSFAKSPSMGIIIAVAGAILSLDGFSQVTKTQETEVNYKYYIRDILEEWDYLARLKITYVSGGGTYSDTYYTDPYGSGDYTWTMEDAFDISGTMYIAKSYYNHHITYRFAENTGKTTVYTEYKESKNVPQGIIGVAILSVGINQIIDSVRESSRISWIPKINVLAKGNEYQVQAVSTITF